LYNIHFVVAVNPLNFFLYKHVMRNSLLVCAGLAVITLSGSFLTLKRQALFNGKDLTGWDTYIGPAYDSIKKDFAGEPVGLNNDRGGLFKVVKEDGEPAIRVSGEKFGGISTKKEFGNYHLRLEFKWGKLKSPPKKNAKRDSGLLYHAVGPHAADWLFWMRSQEFQIQEGDCGDYWGCGGAFATIPAEKKGEDRFVYSPSGPMSLFRDKGPNGRNCIKTPDAEKPSGEWNTIDLYCYGDTSVHMVNGKVVMVLYQLRQPEGSGDIALTKGKIQLQSEGAEVFYRDLAIEDITEIPGVYLK
jgi:hypothetical protein